jgi:hypothetical protein
MSVDILQVRSHEARLQARKTQRKIATQLIILTFVLPIATIGINFIVARWLTYSGQTSLLGTNSTSLYPLVLSPANNWVYVGWLAGALFFSLEAFYFLSLVRKTQFATLRINRGSARTTATTTDHELMRMRRVLEWGKARKEGCPCMKWWLFLFAIIYVALVLYGNYGMVHFKLYDTGFLITGYLLMVSVLACFLYGYHACNASKPIEVSIEDPHLSVFIQEVSVIVPTHVRINESHDIIMEVSLNKPLEPATLAEKGIAFPEYFETELRAAGITVDSEKLMLLDSTSPAPTSIWNCAFQNPGVQTVLLKLSTVNPPKQIITREHTIKVDTTFNLSFQSAVAIIISSISALSGLVATIFKIL